MGKRKNKDARKQKNQLIPKALDEDRSLSVRFIWALGIVLLIISIIWIYLLCTRIAPPVSWFFAFPQDLTQKEVLEHHSHFGHAILAPLELATLGTIILSFVHVIHQLRAQQHTERTRFQPVVSCVALLDYSIEGAEKDEKVNFTNPLVKLRMRNLGDSPATFIDIKIKEFCFTQPGGERYCILDSIKTRYVHVDSLGRYVLGDNSTQYETELLLSDELAANTAKLIHRDMCNLVDGVLHSEDSHPGSLELKICITYENVMRLEYVGEGTFRWSQELCHSDKSDREQIEYIKNFRKARTKNGQEGTPTGRSVSAQHTEQKTTIGQFIKHSKPLQGALKT